MSAFPIFLDPSQLCIQYHSARADTVLPLMWPIKSVDGKSEIKEVSIKKNTTLILSIFNANRHPAVWGDDAEEWKPERWLKPLPDSVAKAHLPSVYSSMSVCTFKVFAKQVPLALLAYGMSDSGTEC